MKALRLNEKDNKSKGKTVEKKEKSGMKTTLNHLREVVKKKKLEIEVKEVEEKEELDRLNSNTQHYSIQTTITINHNSTQFN
jgi:hypothetical protein